MTSDRRNTKGKWVKSIFMFSSTFRRQTGDSIQQSWLLPVPWLLKNVDERVSHSGRMAMGLCVNSSSYAEVKKTPASETESIAAIDFRGAISASAKFDPIFR
jgi:hypothetical protein